MKLKLLTLICLISLSTYSQNQTATTESGKKVILKPDNTWEYSNEKSEQKRKISLEFTSKSKKQFQVVFDAPDLKIIESQAQIGGFQSSGWKKSFYVSNDKMENQISLKVAYMGIGSAKVTLNIYIDNKLVKTETEKAKNLSNPAEIRIDLADYIK